MKIHLAVLGALTTFFLPLAAQEPLPQPGSKEWNDLFNPPYTKPTELPLDHPLRKQLFDLARASLKNHGSVKFEGGIMVYRNWAFFRGMILDEKDTPLVFSQDGPYTTAILWLRSEDGWLIVEHDKRKLDPEQHIWQAKFGVPAEFFIRDEPHEIPMSSPLRKQLFDLLRPKTTAEAAQELRFQGSLKTHNNWAFFNGCALDTKDKPIVFPEGNNSDIVALWLETENGWKLIASATGVTDAFYLGWSHQYGVAAKLLGGK